MTTPARTGARRGTRPPAARPLRAVPDPAGERLRAEQRETFAMLLRTTLSRRGVPYSDRTVGAYLDAVASLARWLTEIGFPGGFDTLTVADLNTYLADYHARHGQNGTVTKQQNLRVFLRFLAEEYDGADLWLDPNRARYQRQEQHPPVLAPDLIRALLKVTGGKTFEDRRDHALLRVLLTGVRRTEVASLRVEDLDLHSAFKSAAVVGLKGSVGRRVPLGDRDALALRRWLHLRAGHRRIRSAEAGPLWLAERTGDPLKPNGIYQMLRRRAVQAGYPAAAIRPHLFRHTAAHELQASGQHSPEEIMALLGWRDRSMLLRYGASMAERRAHEAVARSGFSDRY